MTTKDKIKLLRATVWERRLFACQDLLGDNGRWLKAQIYADVLKRHKNALANFKRVVRAVNRLIAI